MKRSRKYYTNRALRQKAERDKYRDAAKRRLWLLQGALRYIINTPDGRHTANLIEQEIKDSENFRRKRNVTRNTSA